MPWLDPGRSILDGLVFLIPNLPIWAYRFWVSILFIIISFLTALFIIKKAFLYSQTKNEIKKELLILLTMFGTLFLLQGPVYYHVLAGIIPVLWLYDEKRPVRNLIIIVICSMWEGLCRVNWFIMPAVVAIVIYILQTTISKKKLLNYIKWPLYYSISGGVTSFGIYLIYMNTMGFVIPFLNPVMDYAYFLYKLWPNAGYMGLLAGISLLSLPVLLITSYVVWKYRKNFHWLRLLMILGILALFFAISTIISLRAGGGYDLHNYDTFLLLLLITGCYFGMHAVQMDAPLKLGKTILMNYGAVVVLLVIPVIMAFPKTTLRQYASNSQTDQTLQDIRKTLQSTTISINHPVLFIDQRQLLVFHILSGYDIYVPYEKIELMEMAMARNQGYKQTFVNNLQNHKYSFIVSEVLTIWAKHFDPNLFDRDWFENNVWIDFVGIPVLDYYSPIYINTNIGIAIYAPKK